MYQKKTTEEEKLYYHVCDRLENNLELVAYVMRDLGLKQKRSDILRKFRYLKFDKPKEENEYFLEFEQYFNRIKNLSQNEINYYKLEINNLEDEFKDRLDFTKEEKKLKVIKKDLEPLGFTETQIKLICFRELNIEEMYDKKIAKLNKKIRTLESKKNVIGVQQVLFS